MNLLTFISSVVVGLLAGLLGPMVVAAIGAMRALLHLYGDVTRTAKTAEKPTSTHACPGTDAASAVKMPGGRRHPDKGSDEFRPAA